MTRWNLFLLGLVSGCGWSILAHVLFYNAIGPYRATKPELINMPRKVYEGSHSNASSAIEGSHSSASLSGRGDLLDTSNPKSRRGLVLSYAGNNLELEGFSLFARSLRATNSKCAVVVITKNFNPSRDHVEISKQFDVQFVPAVDLIASQPHDHVLQRFFHWHHYLRKYGHLFDFVINCDWDVFFQIEPFDFFFGFHSPVHSNQSLHVFAENPIVSIGDCPIHSSWYRECPLMNGTSLLAEHAGLPRICAGITIGTRFAHQLYLERMVLELERTGCNDQGIHNMVLWRNSFPLFDVLVWDNWDGPVKHMDVGYIRDQYGRVLNEQGLPYCVLHQFRRGRNPTFVDELTSLLARPMMQRIAFEDTRFEVCTLAPCRGKKLHVHGLLMIKKNVTKGFWGDLPTQYSPFPKNHPVLLGYRTVASFLAGGS
jgi:hypothetical protein